MKKIIGLSAIILAVLFMSGCRSGAVYNIVDAPIEAAKNTSDDKVYKAIKKAGFNLGWIIKKVKPGVATAQINLRSHMALVQIKYNKNSYSITYKNSLNLNYNPADNTIHNNYNGWVQNLNNAIQVQLSMLAE
jgi:hypothetical protein